MKRWILPILLLAGAATWAWFAFGPARLVNDPPPAGPIVAFGDSLTFGAGAEPGEAYPAQLGRLLGRPVVNCGVGGDTIEEAARRLDRDVLARKPGVAIVLLGGNDLLRERDLDAAFAVLEQTVLRIEQSGALVVLVGLKGLSPVGGVAGRYRALARKTGALFVPDILGGILGDRTLMSDRVHPNAAGYKLIAERVAKAIGPHLPPVPPPKPAN